MHISILFSRTRIERLDNYVAELPTAEDHKRLKKEVS